MELFGFSAAKIITILIIAVVIFGPAQVAEMVKTVGRTIREVRRYINEMSKEFNEATGGLREEFAGIAQDLRGELAATQADLRSQLDLTGIFAEATATVTESRATPPVIALGGVGPPLASPIPLGNIGTPTTVGVSRAVIVPADEEAKKAPRWVTQTDLSASLAVLATPGTTTQSIPPPEQNRRGHHRNDDRSERVRQRISAPGSRRAARSRPGTTSCRVNVAQIATSACRGPHPHLSMDIVDAQPDATPCHVS